MERSFITIFKPLEDPRNEKGRKYPLLDVEKFMELFVEWMREVIQYKGGKHIAIDGKAVRAATKKAMKGHIPYVVSAYMCECGLIIGQKEVGAKTNEITEIPKLLDLIDISGCTITIDAIGTQTAIMDKIIVKKGHYCLQLKKNQRTTYEGVELYFQDLLADKRRKPETYVTTSKDHGRIEKRTYCTVSGVISNLTLLRKIAFNLTKMVPGEEKKSTKKRIIDFMMNIEVFKKFIYETLPAHGK